MLKVYLGFVVVYIIYSRNWPTVDHQITYSYLKYIFCLICFQTLSLGIGLHSFLQHILSASPEHSSLRVLDPE